MNENELINGLMTNPEALIIPRNYIMKYGIKTAAVFSELFSEYQECNSNGKTDNGWFFSTVENLAKGCGVERRSQETAIKTLVEDGIIQYEVKGLPAKRYFKFIF